MSDETFLHLTSGRHAAEVVRAALGLLGRDETVLFQADAHTDGPLHDVDSGAVERIAWWNRIRVQPLDETEAKNLDDAALWEQVRADRSHVVLWHGPHPADRLFELRACWKLREEAPRIWEVALAAGTSRDLPEFYGAVAIWKPEEAADRWERRAKVADVEARAAEWVTLRDEPGEWLRALDDGGVVRRPITAHDSELIDACRNGDWTKSARVVGTVLAEHPTSDTLLFWRLRELIRMGSLEGRGYNERLGMVDEVRPKAGS